MRQVGYLPELYKDARSEKYTNLEMERKLEVMPASMHVPGLFTGSNGLVFLWGPVYSIGKGVDLDVQPFFAGGTCKN